MGSEMCIRDRLYLAAAVPIMWASIGFRNDFRAAARLSQDQAGDLATTVEESVHGIRVLKAFGRGGHALDGFRGEAETLQGTEVHKASVLAKFISLTVSLPELVLGVALGLGLYLTLQLLITAAGVGPSAGPAQLFALARVVVFALVTGRIIKLATCLLYTSPSPRDS